MATGYTEPAYTEPPKIEMTPEEKAYYLQCSKEAMSKRGLPYAASSVLGTFIALKLGFLKPNAKFGYAPSLITAGLFGSVVGIISYRAVCMQKVLDLPDSNLRKQLEATLRQNNVPRPLGPEVFVEEKNPPMISGSQMDTYQSANDFDGFTGVHTDGDAKPQDNNWDLSLPPISSTYTTHDELRQRNRDEYLRGQISSNYQPPIQPPKPPTNENLPFDRDRPPQYQLND